MSPNESSRFTMRQTILRHPALSHGAVRLYTLLDDYAGFKGEAWPSQAALARDLGGVTDRMVRLWLAELHPAFVCIVRRQRTAAYVLSWRSSDRKPISSQESQSGSNEHSDRKYISGLANLSLYEPSIEPSFSREPCEKCQDTGFVAVERAGLSRVSACTCAIGCIKRKRA